MIVAFVSMEIYSIFELLNASHLTAKETECGCSVDALMNLIDARALEVKEVEP